jgi:hypothetical protein
MIPTIPFKSSPENFRKEYLGWKSNTVRRLPTGDFRRQILDDWISGKITLLMLEITNSTNSDEMFARLITDVTYWEGIYIISW